MGATPETTKIWVKLYYTVKYSRKSSILGVDYLENTVQTIISILIVAAVFVLTSFTVSQENRTDGMQIYTSQGKSDTIVDDKLESLLRETQLINSVQHKGKSSYTGEFTTAPEQGKYLNVYCKNNGTGTIYMTIKRNKLDFVSNLEIAPGNQRTQTFKELYKEGLTGEWEVYVFSRDGHEMSLEVSAKQY